MANFLIICCVTIGIYCLRPWIDRQILNFRIRRMKSKDSQQQQQQNMQADLLIRQAKDALAKDNCNPFDLDLLTAAVEYYHQSYLLSSSYLCLNAIEELEMEIERRRQFQSLFRQATDDFHFKRFGDAAIGLAAARELYAPPQLLATIDRCHQEYEREKVYLQSLDRAKKLSFAGKFRDALSVVNAAVAEFDREDGERLQISLNRAIAAREQLNLGKIEHQLGDFTAAQAHYRSALTLLPQWREPKLRLATIAARTAEIDTSIDLLVEIDLPHARRLLGWLYLRQQQYLQAHTVWTDADRELMYEYGREVANTNQAQRQLIQPRIQQLIESGNLDRARSLSLEFLDRFGSDLLIQTNLKDCIEPAIETQIWATRDWARLAIYAREHWLSNSDSKSLHNWAICLYYATQIDDDLEELIVAWSTAIANISRDPSIADLPWFGTRSLAPSEVGKQLWQVLEQRIEPIKEIDLPRYLDLRDRFRQEFWADELARTDSTATITAGESIVAPACYQRYYSHLSLGDDLEIWKTLYTTQGTAVAACLAGDPQRAEVLSTNAYPNSNLEEFAYHFILYDCGCNYLQQQDWRQAIYQLDLAKNTIRDNDEWWMRIDQLCIHLRQKITDFDEHQDFARFWYDLLSSDRSVEYFIEYQALKIQWEWSESIVTDGLSLVRIQDLLNEYPSHPVVREIFDQIFQYSLNN